MEVVGDLLGVVGDPGGEGVGGDFGDGGGGVEWGGFGPVVVSVFAWCGWVDGVFGFVADRSSGLGTVTIMVSAGVIPES